MSSQLLLGGGVLSSTQFAVSVPTGSIIQSTTFWLGMEASTFSR